MEEDQAENLKKELESKHSFIDEEEEPKKKNVKQVKGGQKPVGNINKTADSSKEKGKTAGKSQGSVNESDDHFEEFLHPNLRNSKVNEQRESIETRRKNFNSCKSIL